MATTEPADRRGVVALPPRLRGLHHALHLGGGDPPRSPGVRHDLVPPTPATLFDHVLTSLLGLVSRTLRSWLPSAEFAIWRSAPISPLRRFGFLVLQSNRKRAIEGGRCLFQRHAYTYISVHFVYYVYVLH